MVNSMSDNNREQNTLNNILKAIDLEPIEVSEATIRKQKFIRFISNRWVNILACLIICAVLSILITHLIGAIRDQRTEFSIKDHYIEGESFILSVDGGLIDADKSYMVNTSNDVTVHPYVNPKGDKATFSYHGGEYNVYVVSRKGECIYFILSGE